MDIPETLAQYEDKTQKHKNTILFPLSEAHDLLMLFVFIYVGCADDHVNNVSYIPFMSIKKVAPYFCALREGYYVADC
jgi:hypothetical protein